MTAVTVAMRPAVPVARSSSTRPRTTNSNNSAGDDINNVDAAGAGGPVSVGNEDNDSAGGDQTNVGGSVGGNVDASHDDNSVHEQTDIHQGVDVDLF